MSTDAPAAFFSYSREDSEFTLRLAGDLKAAGANVWMDQLDIAPGQRWDRSVEDALTHCPRLLVVLSPSSVNSTNVLDEVSFALENQKTIIPVLYRNCAIPFRLRRIQYLDFRTDYAHGLKALLQTLTVEQPGQSSVPLSSVSKESQSDLSKAEPSERTGVQKPLEEEKHTIGIVSLGEKGRQAIKQAQFEQGRKLAAEQARLEQERRQVAERARLEEERNVAAAVPSDAVGAGTAIQGAPVPVAPTTSEVAVGPDPTPTSKRVGLILAVVAAVLVVGAVVAYMMMTSKQVTVPDLTGTTLPNATAKLRALKLAVGQTTSKEDATKDPNIVLGQSPAANTSVRSGTTVDLVVSQQPQQPRMVEVPSLVGKSLDAARQTLEDRQLTVGNIAREPKSGVPRDTVVEQFPGAGGKINTDSKVDVKVSEEAAPVGKNTKALSKPTIVDSDTVIPAARFSRGVNVEVGKVGWGADLVHNAAPYLAGTPNEVEYQLFSGKGGRYNLSIQMAAAQPRPVDIVLNGEVVAWNVLAVTTGTWEQNGAKWVSIGELTLRPGSNSLVIRRADVFPHLLALRLSPRT